MPSKFFIFGSGAQGRVALDNLLSTSKYDDIYFVEDNQNIIHSQINGCTVISRDMMYEFTSRPEMYIAVGHPQSRKKLYEEFRDKCDFPNIIHNSAVVAPSSKIGIGNFIGAFSLINSNAVIKDFSIINNGVIIEHDSNIGNFSSISPGCIIGGRVDVGDSVFVGSGSIIQARTTVQDTCIIGMGSNVTKDCSSGVLYYGNPAKNIRTIDEIDWKKVL